MSMDLTISLLGIYNQDPEIMDEDHLLLPDEVDRDILVPMALAETAELESLYPAPEPLKIVMRAWSGSRLPSWERMITALEAEYNPIHNYDRTEEETGSRAQTEDENISDQTAEGIRDSSAEARHDKVGETVNELNTGSRSSSGSSSSNSSDTGSDVESTAEMVQDAGSTTGSGTSTGQVTGFNASTFADDNKTINSSSGTTSGSRDRSQTVTNTRSGGSDTQEERSETGSSTDTAKRDRDMQSSGSVDSTSTRDRDQSFSRSRNADTSDTHTRKLRAFGNIGVTRTQEMITDELELRMMDIYRIIIDELRSYFCLRVY